MITWLIRLSPGVHNNSLAPGQRHSMLSVKCQHPILLVVGGTIMKLLLLLLFSVLGEAQEVRIEDDGKEGRIDETSIDCVTAGEMLFRDVGMEVTISQFDPWLATDDQWLNVGKKH